MIAVSELRQGRILEPKAFCEKYARLPEGTQGYKGNWKRLLAYVLGLSEKTIEEWGTAPDFLGCPERYKKDLERIDALNAAERVLKAHGLQEEYLKSLE